MSRAKVSESPSDLTETFESAGDRLRREWAEHSGTYAWAVLKALQGPYRSREISLSELLTTKLYARATQREKTSLRWIAEQSDLPLELLSENDRNQLAEMDEFICAFADGTAPIGHADRVQGIRGIAATIARAQAVDAGLFPKQFPEKILFRWIWRLTNHVATTQ